MIDHERLLDLEVRFRNQTTITPENVLWLIQQAKCSPDLLAAAKAVVSSRYIVGPGSVIGTSGPSNESLNALLESVKKAEEGE